MAGRFASRLHKKEMNRGIYDDMSNPSTRGTATEDLDFRASLGYMVRLYVKRQREGGGEEGGRDSGMKMEGGKEHKWIHEILSWQLRWCLLST